MTEDELNRLEALANNSVENGYTFTAVKPDTLFSLIRLARIGLAVTPRPISEAPKDGAKIIMNGAVICAWEPSIPEPAFMDNEGNSYFDGTHFIPLSALPKPGDRT